MKHDRKASLNDRLKELSESGSVSAFSRSYYEFIANEIDKLEDAPGVSGISIAFEDLIAGEIRYYASLNGVTENDHVSFEQFQELTLRRRTNIEHVAGAISAISASSQRVKAVQYLITAECYYHLRRSSAVVEQLGYAIDCGADHHLVHFALGYNIYAMGVERHTKISADAKSLVTADPVAFQGYCQAAVAAFEIGLTGTEFDAQIFWWMAQIFAAAGMVDAAADIQNSLRAKYGVWNDEDDEDDELLAVEELPKITKGEIRQAGEILNGRFSLMDVMGYGFDEQ